jgi:hypothetical protein
VGEPEKLARAVTPVGVAGVVAGMNHALLALTTTLAAFSLSGCLDEPDRVEEFDYVDAVERLELLTGSGDVEVQVDASVRKTHVRASVYGDSTEVVTRFESGVLQLRHDCPKRFRQCGVDWLVVLPPSEAARIFEAGAGSGDIDFFDTEGTLVVHTGSGDIGLHDVIATDVDLETGSGDIGARVTGLESLRAKTGSGDVGLGVPGGGYLLDIDTGSGDVSKRGVSSDSASDRVLEIRTGSGDVAVRAL